MTNKTLTLFGFTLRATDALILFILAFFSALALIFHGTVEGWWLLVLKNLAAAVGYLVVVWLSGRATKKFLRFFLRVAAITLAYAYLFGAVDKLQLIIHGEWLDAYVLDAEQYVFGVQPTLWLQQFTSRPLTEWMMFAYVIYVPLYPVLCGIIYYRHGDVAMEDYFFTLGFTNILCDFGFILFPIAGPMFTIGHLYSVPLDGYVFTYFGELMRSQLHYVGGNLPSPHTAAATIMWIMAYRYDRRWFYALAPVVLTLYVSTFYGRYHYMTDAVIGIAVAFLALALVPFLIRWWDKVSQRQSSPASAR